jgi:hypothetical protein
VPDVKSAGRTSIPVARNSAAEQRLPEPADARDERQASRRHGRPETVGAGRFNRLRRGRSEVFPAAKISGSA